MRRSRCRFRMTTLCLTPHSLQRLIFHGGVLSEEAKTLADYGTTFACRKATPLSCVVSWEPIRPASAHQRSHAA